MSPRSPLRVLHVVQPVEGGAARVVGQLVRDQRERGWDVLVASPDGGPLATDVAATGAVQLPWDARRGPRAGSPAQVAALRALVRDAAPDVVHLHSASAGMTGRLAVRGSLPTVYQPHGWSWQAVDGVVARATVRWERLAQRWSSLVVCVSDDERQAGARHGVDQRLVVVPNGVDLELFRAVDDAQRAAARRALGLGPEPLVVCVGRLTEQKGHAVLVDAWAQVVARAPGARLALVGDGECAAALRDQVRQLGLTTSVVLAGARDDVPDWYAACDVVVFPSLHGEAMALTPLEAQASGRALVASDVAGVRESLGAGAGAVVPPGRAGPLAEALVDRLTDPSLAGAEGARGRAHAERSLSVRVTARQVAAHVARLAGRPEELPLSG